MKQIIAIGGGGFARANADLKIERYICEQAVSKKKLKICFLPQASNESHGYIVKFFEAFLALGAEPTWLSLFDKVAVKSLDKLLDQDIIYVGGGNTRSMLALWREWGVDNLLKQAYEAGIILAGVSAGAICWFEQGLTDSVWPLGAINALGIIRGSFCPHFDSEIERQDAYRSKIKSGVLKPGLALDDYTAVHFIDGELKQVIKSDASRSALKISPTEELTLSTVLL